MKRLSTWDKNKETNKLFYLVGHHPRLNKNPELLLKFIAKWFRVSATQPVCLLSFWMVTKMTQNTISLIWAARWSKWWVHSVFLVSMSTIKETIHGFRNTLKWSVCHSSTVCIVNAYFTLSPYRSAPLEPIAQLIKNTICMRSNYPSSCFYAFKRVLSSFITLRLLI